MLKKLNETSSPTNKANHFSGYRIIGEFCIEESHFLIISTDEFTEETASLTDSKIFANIPFSVLGHFDFGGNCYLIVNSQNIAEDVDPNIASLLTDRELQIAALIALGWSNKQVANQLRISEWTVSAHLRRIFIKLDVDSRAAMVYRCSSLIHKMHQLRSMTSLIRETLTFGD
jgi:DNA-binding CsgD family transcriptional regulator